MEEEEEGWFEGVVAFKGVILEEVELCFLEVEGPLLFFFFTSFFPFESFGSPSPGGGGSLWVVSIWKSSPILEMK